MADDDPKLDLKVPFTIDKVVQAAKHVFDWKWFDKFLDEEEEALDLWIKKGDKKHQHKKKKKEDLDDEEDSDGEEETLSKWPKPKSPKKHKSQVSKPDSPTGSRGGVTQGVNWEFIESF